MFRSAYANLLLVCCFAPGTRQSKVQYSSRLQNICFVRSLVREIYVFRNICFYMPTFMLHEMLSTSEIHVLFVGGSGKGHNCNDIYIYKITNTAVTTQFVY